VSGSDPVDPRAVREELTRFLMAYKSGIEELMTKVRILQDEFRYIHDYNPIEHVGSRLKSPESILRKTMRKGWPLTLADLRTQMLDIAGVRITCSFISDTYRIKEMLARQSDLTVLEVRDYIAEPKPNGYQSLHMIVEIPVFMSDRTETVRVEVQIRTIAMDFWASLEHKIYYKYDREVPAALVEELREAAEAAARLDAKMELLHDEVSQLGPPSDDQRELRFGELQLPVPEALIEAFLRQPQDPPSA
jgi:putative GTP pyrophosphokinase